VHGGGFPGAGGDAGILQNADPRVVKVAARLFQLAGRQDGRQPLGELAGQDSRSFERPW
jgi:hypothetical protein